MLEKYNKRRISIDIFGVTPRPWGVKMTKAWREEIKRQVDDIKIQRTIISKEHRAKIYNVTIVFYFTAKNLYNCDLDNLAKPVIDTLFDTSRNQQKTKNPVKVLFTVDDAKVTRLKLEKREVSSSHKEEGCNILVTW